MYSASLRQHGNRLNFRHRWICRGIVRDRLCSFPLLENITAFIRRQCESCCKESKGNAKTHSLLTLGTSQTFQCNKASSRLVRLQEIMQDCLHVKCQIELIIVAYMTSPQIDNNPLCSSSAVWSLLPVSLHPPREPH